jgi:hypothetical protein
MLNLALNPLRNAWEELEEELSLCQISLGEEIVCENLEEEKQLTIAKGGVIYHDGKVGILVAGDTRWDQRASGRSYNSNSGTSLLCGNLSKKCVGIECMSKRCSKCDPRDRKQKEYRESNKVPTLEDVFYFNETHEAHRCPQNYVGSPQGMEAKGAFKIVVRVYNSKSGVFIHTYVMDDDSSTKSILKHSFQAMIDNGIMREEDWPLTGAGKRAFCQYTCLK